MFARPFDALDAQAPSSWSDSRNLASFEVLYHAQHRRPNPAMGACGICWPQPPGRRRRLVWDNKPAALRREPNALRLVDSSAPSSFGARLRRRLYRPARAIVNGPKVQTDPLPRCYIAALEAIGGAPRAILYDRTRTAVIGEDADGRRRSRPPMGLQHPRRRRKLVPWQRGERGCLPRLGELRRWLRYYFCIGPSIGS